METSKQLVERENGESRSSETKPNGILNILNRFELRQSSEDVLKDDSASA